jgi:hypothetical protein
MTALPRMKLPPLPDFGKPEASPCFVDALRGGAAPSRVRQYAEFALIETHLSLGLQRKRHSRSLHALDAMGKAVAVPRSAAGCRRREFSEWRLRHLERDVPPASDDLRADRSKPSTSRLATIRAIISAASCFRLRPSKRSANASASARSSGATAGHVPIFAHSERCRVERARP